MATLNPRDYSHACCKYLEVRWFRSTVKGRGIVPSAQDSAFAHGQWPHSGEDTLDQLRAHKCSLLAMARGTPWLQPLYPEMWSSTAFSTVSLPNLCNFSPKTLADKRCAHTQLVSSGELLACSLLNRGLNIFSSNTWEQKGLLVFLNSHAMHLLLRLWLNRYWGLILKANLGLKAIDRKLLLNGCIWRKGSLVPGQGSWCICEILFEIWLCSLAFHGCLVWPERRWGSYRAGEQSWLSSTLCSEIS